MLFVSDDDPAIIKGVEPLRINYTVAVLAKPETSIIPHVLNVCMRK